MLIDIDDLIRFAKVIKRYVHEVIDKSAFSLAPTPNNPAEKHTEGPMADDTIYNYVQNYLDGEISREAFWELAKFKHPTHQISFHSAKALACLSFVSAEEVYREG